MSQELKIGSTNITYNKGGAKTSVAIDALAVDVSGTEVAEGVVSVATTAGALTLPAAPGLCFVKNLDSTNFIQVGPDATNWFVKLTPEMPWAIFPLNGTAIQAKADTAPCNLQYKVFSL